MTEQELEIALRTMAARDLPDSPTAEQCARILERRSRGERITLAKPGEHRRFSALTSGIGLAALAAGVGAVVLVSRPDRSVQLNSGARQAPPLFGPAELMAQPTSRPQFPVLSAPSRPLRSAQWMYAADPLDQIRSWDMLYAFRLVPSNYQGAAAWLLLAGTQSPDSAPIFTDSTWVSREGLALLSHRRDTTVTVQPIPGLFLAILQSAELSKDWSASIPVQITRGGSGEIRWMNLKVYGTEVVESPAGKFKCWKVGFSPEIRFYFWISEDGWPVMQGTNQLNMAYGKMNLLLVRREEL